MVLLGDHFRNYLNDKSKRGFDLKIFKQFIKCVMELLFCDIITYSDINCSETSLARFCWR